MIFKGFIAKNSSEALSETVEKLVSYNIAKNLHITKWLVIVNLVYNWHIR